MTSHAPQPPVDPEIARAMDENRELIVTGMTAADIIRVRSLGVTPTIQEATRHGAFTRYATSIPKADGTSEVPVVVYLPVASRRAVPAFVYLHGGGMIAGTADSDMPAISELADAVGCAIVSVDYRLAPESAYPAALEDAVAVVRWVGSLDCPPGIDPHRIILGGVSAGGGLAAATALFLRDHGGPLLAALMLICPMLDCRSSSFSAQQMVGAGSWDATANETAWDAYLGASGIELDPPAYASAARTTNYGGLAPTFVDVGSAETFRDECVAFADGIWRAGGDAELHVWPGGIHAFDFLAPWAALSRAARGQRVAWLSRVLSRA